VIHQAIRERRQIKVHYQSLSSEPRWLILEPHTLVFNGFRWHIRAFSHEHNDYRDFVLARFISLPEFADSATHFVENDANWNLLETLVIAPHPELSPEQQAVVADDFGMTDGKLHLPVRRAMRLYVLRMLHLDQSSLVPKIQQIVWLNREQAEIESPDIAQ
jgi:predicted DNA-binding transcriptional regulator YafY